MVDMFFWSLMITIIIGLSIPMLGYIRKYLYPEHQTKISIKKTKIIFAYSVGPLVCSVLYTISPLHSFTSFMVMGVIGFLISSIVFWLNINEDIQSTSSEKPLAKIEIYLLMLSLIIPNFQLFILFSLIFAGFHIPW